MKPVWMILGFAAAVLPASLRADDDTSGALTYHKDIEPIIQQACQSCHRNGVTNGGTTAPMTLMTFDEVRPWVKSIVKSVTSRQMPPWHASPEFHGVFSNERTLTAAEIGLIERWARQGAPQGNPKDAPAPVVFPGTEWGIGQPDLVVGFDKPFRVADEVEDLYQNIIVKLTPEQLPEDRWIKAIEFKAGSNIVHHIIGYNLDPKEQASDAVERGNERHMLGGIAPGNEPDIFPAGYGKLLKKGSKLVFAMHYHKTPGAGTAVDDLSSVAFRFYEKGEKVEHPVVTSAIGNYSFEIPPGHPDWEVGAARVFEHDTTILSLMPHMHLRGKAARYTAFYPDGSSEVLLDVPRYDFNWQTGYEFKTMKRIPAGTRIEVTMRFDNSKANPANPDPGQTIRFGGPTTDEMMLGWLDYTTEQPEADRSLARAE